MSNKKESLFDDLLKKLPPEILAGAREAAMPMKSQAVVSNKSQAAVSNKNQAAASIESEPPSPRNNTKALSRKTHTSLTPKPTTALTKNHQPAPPATTTQRLPITGLRNPISGQDIILLPHDRAAYLQLGHDFFRDLAPSGIREVQIVQQIVDLTWRLNRLGAIENNLMVSGMVDAANKYQGADPRAAALASLAFAFRKDVKETRTFRELGLYEAGLRRQIAGLNREIERLSAARTRDAAGNTVTITVESGPSLPLAWYRDALDRTSDELLDPALDPIPPFRSLE